MLSLLSCYLRIDSKSTSAAIIIDAYSARSCNARFEIYLGFFGLSQCMTCLCSISAVVSPKQRSHASGSRYGRSLLLANVVGDTA